MHSIDWLQLGLFVMALALITKPLGLYLVQVLDANGRTWFDPIVKPFEQRTYRLIGVKSDREQDWKEYAFAMLLFSLVYDDAWSKAWTNQVRDRLSKVVGEPKVDWSEWKLADLHDAGVSHRGSGLWQRPMLLRSESGGWDRCQAHSTYGSTYGYTSATARIALVDAAADPLPEPHHILDYLRTVAGQGRLDFLVQECRQPTESSSLSQEDLEWAEAV